MLIGGKHDDGHGSYTLTQQFEFENSEEWRVCIPIDPKQAIIPRPNPWRNTDSHREPRASSITFGDPEWSLNRRHGSP